MVEGVALQIESQRLQPIVPKTISLPMGLQPEGITRGPGARAFVGAVNAAP